MTAPEPQVGDTPVKVWAWCNSGNGTDWQEWLAIAEDGEVLCSHVSSSRGWGQRDVGPSGFYTEKYVAKFGERFMDRLDYIVVAEREAPPAEVYERNQERARAEVAKAADSAVQS